MNVVLLYVVFMGIAAAVLIVIGVATAVVLLTDEMREYRARSARRRGALRNRGVKDGGDDQ